MSEVSKNLQTSSTSKNILFLGNSLAREGLDLEVFDSVLNEDGLDNFWTAKATADGTTALEWYLLFQKYFVSEGSIPDVVVIGFSSSHLEDRITWNMLRMGNLYCGRGQIVELFRDYVHSLGDRMDFLLARFSSMYATSDRMRRRVLDMCVPNYRFGLDKIRSVLLVSPVTKTKDNKREYKALKKLIESFKEQDVLVVFVAMPLVDQWEIKPELRQVIEETGMKLIDCRDAELIPSKHFSDQVHLNSEGAEINTSLFAEQFIDVTKTISDENKKH